MRLSGRRAPQETRLPDGEGGPPPSGRLPLALRCIEWPTLVFFLDLFVMVGALEHTGAIKEVANAIADVTDGDRSVELLGITWASAIGSGVIDKPANPDDDPGRRATATQRGRARRTSDRASDVPQGRGAGKARVDAAGPPDIYRGALPVAGGNADEPSRSLGVQDPARGRRSRARGRSAILAGQRAHVPAWMRTALAMIVCGMSRESARLSARGRALVDRRTADRSRGATRPGRPSAPADLRNGDAPCPAADRTPPRDPHDNDGRLRALADVRGSGWV